MTQQLPKPRQAKYRVAAIQYEPKLLAREINVAELMQSTEQAASNDAKIIVLPKMATTGICLHDRSEGSQIAEANQRKGSVQKATHAHIKRV